MGNFGNRLDAAGLVLGRVLIAVLFLHEGYAKTVGYSAAVRYAEAYGVPGWMLPGAVAVEIGCGLMLVAGFRVPIAAGVLCVFSLATAAIFHSQLGQTNQLLHFEKNFAIAGGLLVLAILSRVCSRNGP